jgi:hypothetical protein
MANQFLDVILPELMDELGVRVNLECPLTKNCYTKASGIYAGYGDTVQVILPQYFTATQFTGTTTAQPIKMVTQDITMNKFPTIDIEIGSKEAALNLNDFKMTIMDPMVEGIKAFINIEGMRQIYQETYNLSGTAGTPPNSYKNFLDANIFLDKMGIPKAGRLGILESSARNAMLGNQTNGTGLLNIFNEKRADELLAGYLYDLDQVPLYQSEAVANHTAGNVTTAQTIQVNANVAEGATSISLKGFTASTGSLKKGDVFTIAGIYSLNFQKRETTGLLQRFVVLEDATANSSGVVTVDVSPRVTSLASTSLYSQYPTVTSLPLENAAVTILTAGTANGQTSFQNLIYHKNAVALVTAQLNPPAPGVWTYYTPITTDTPIQLRATYFYDITTKTNKMAIDCLFGFKVVAPWSCVRLQG